jgi:hypothetical protein
MNLVSSDTYSGPKPREQPACKCGAQPMIVRKMMDSKTGKTVRMFECQCGTRSWTEAKE